MIEKLHDHVIDELRTNTKTDTIFALTSILLNFIALGINWAVAEGDETIESSATVIFILIVTLVIVVNSVAVIGLLRGRQTREKLLTGLLKLYKDQEVEQYYDSSILAAYNTRYILFIITVVFTGFIAIAVPLVQMVLE
ncbi:MAG: hypothetical protein HN368_01930 [Spirochaetales bacterium]|jgi:hypothetical protein|nr:hypothetical protein [Spirochaetales bacterium]